MVVLYRFDDPKIFMPSTLMVLLGGGFSWEFMALQVLVPMARSMSLLLTVKAVGSTLSRRDCFPLLIAMRGMDR